MKRIIFDPHSKLLWYGDRVREWLTTGKTNPILAEISPTGYCNATCPWCFFADKHSKVRIDPEVMLRTIDDLATLKCEAINWSGGGEPSIHPDFARFVERAAERGIKQGLYTNGYKEIPHQDKFSWIRVSFTERGFNLIKRPHVPFGMRLNHTKEYTRQDLIDFCVGARDFGASYFQITPALETSYKDQPDLEVPEFLLEYETNDFKVHVTHYKYEEAVRPKEYNECYGYHFCPSIDWHGHITVCLYLTLDKAFELGDLNKESLLEIWPKIVAKAPVVEKCQNCCKNSMINKVLYDAKQVSDTSFL